MSWISDLGDFISNIPIVGNIVDFTDKALYDVFDTVGSTLGLNKKGNLLGMGVDEFKDRLLHPLGIAAATWGIGNALTAPAAVGGGAAAGMGEAGMGVGMGGAGEISTGLSAGMGGAGEIGAGAAGAGATGITSTTPLITEAAGGTAGASAAPFVVDSTLAPTVGGTAGTVGAGSGLTADQIAAISAAGAKAGTATTQGVTMGTAAGSGVGGYLSSAAKLMKDHPVLTTMGANLLSSALQSGLVGDANDAQAESYQAYLNSLNPTEAVKGTRFNQLAENARTQGALTQTALDESLAERGVRGKGKAAPTGDASLLTKNAINNAYNQVYGSYNVPGVTPPVNYTPNPLATAGVGALQSMTQAEAMKWLLNNANNQPNA